MSATIDFITGWNGTDKLVRFGTLPAGGTPIYGQEFIIPDSTNIVLVSWEFEIHLPTTCTFIAYLYEYDESTGKIIGSSLFTSSDIVPPSSGWNKVTLNPNVTLNSTKKYVMIYQADISASGNDGMGVDYSSDYSGSVPFGGFLFQNGDGTYPVGLLTRPMTSGFIDPSPMAFKATFNPSSGGVIDNSTFFVTD